MKTRLRPHHRRALLAALPPLAAELSDGRLVALAAELLQERGPDAEQARTITFGPMVTVGGHPIDARGAELLGLRPDPPPIVLKGEPLDIVCE